MGLTRVLPTSLKSQGAGGWGEFELRADSCLPCSLLGSHYSELPGIHVRPWTTSRKGGSNTLDFILFCFSWISDPYWLPTLLTSSLFIYFKIFLDGDSFQSLYWIWYSIISVLCSVSFGLEAYRILVPLLEIEFGPLALEGEVSTPGPPEKSPVVTFTHLYYFKTWTTIPLEASETLWSCWICLVMTSVKKEGRQQGQVSSDHRLWPSVICPPIM